MHCATQNPCARKRKLSITVINHPIRLVWRRIRRVARLLRWGSTAVTATATGVAHKNRRLLIIYDLSSQPFSIGDILIFQEASLVLRERHGVDKVDFALVYDPRSPVVSDPAFRNVDAESFLFHLSSVLPAAQVNPHLGSLFLFDSHRQLERHIADNAGDYVVWPTLVQYASRDYLFYHCFNELFREHFELHGCLPTIGSRPAASAWARQFLVEHAGESVPVTIQLRRNPANPARNSDIDAWIAFFRHCAGAYDAKFVIICGRNEIDGRLRELPNVIVAKDHGTSTEQDLALIEVSDLHMGMASGPGTMAHFSLKPYCMFKWDLKLGSIDGLVNEGHRYRFPFSTPLQNWIFGNESEALLKTEFQHIWNGRQGSSC